MQALFSPKQTSARMEYLRTSGRLVAKKPLTVLKNALKRLQKNKMEGENVCGQASYSQTELPLGNIC